MVDTTMLFAPKSGGIKRYLLAKRHWLAEHRPAISHTLVAPGAATRRQPDKGMVTIASPRLPFGDGYRWCASIRKWSDQIVLQRPDLIEVGDPYGPAHAALDAGERLGVPVVGFCHSDPAALAALHIGEWVEPAVRRRWARLFRRFDRVVAPSRHIAERLYDAGVPDVQVQHLGVDTDIFHPSRADRAGLLKTLGLPGSTRLLVFAGRPAREKNIDVLLEAAARLGPPYHLVLIGAGALSKPQPNATFIDYRREPKDVARLIASCDAFVHANDREPFGLIVLEAMACGLPIVGVASGGVLELVDGEVGQLAARAEAGVYAEAVDALFARDLLALSKAARERAVARHGWNAVFERLFDLYGQIASAPPRAVPIERPVFAGGAW
jgi:alpha-1,6-mannosyltransferase